MDPYSYNRGYVGDILGMMENKMETTIVSSERELINIGISITFAIPPFPANQK